MKSNLDMSVYHAHRLAARDLAAFGPYVTERRTKTVLALGTRVGQPRLLASWPIDEFAIEAIGSDAWEFWPNIGLDALTVMVFTLAPFQANLVASRLMQDGTVPEILSGARLAWIYGDRSWARLDRSTTLPAHVTPLRAADPVLARLWALRLHALAYTHSDPDRKRAVRLPDFWQIPDGAHLATWGGFTLHEWLLDDTPLCVAEARDLAYALLTADTGSVAAAAIDQILGASIPEAARIDLWERAARASTGPARSSAAALVALGLWRWGDPKAAATAAHAVDAHRRNVLACFIADLIAQCPEVPSGFFDSWHPSAQTAIRADGRA
ncbi:hypothetical protein [Glycomyces sp. NPDC047010]|uniref:hypothetical protein n=1 Tax=Glycomyces sp. NPDC047010 TaxID=3155023 RepID=UPI0034098228